MELNIIEAQQQQQQQVNESQQQPSNQQQQQQSQQQTQQQQQPPYTIPGILHYLQYEWHRFEVERQEWEVEKAELSARISLLQGEKKSHENLKHDLIRRIKMLEYCLRMERAKYHKLKHGTDPPPIENSTTQAPKEEENENSQNAQNDESFPSSNNNSSMVTHGRELLKHYLQEIGYTDTIIDLRSNRVRSLLGIVDNQTSNQQHSTQQQQQQLQQQQSQQLQNSNQATTNSNANANSNNDQKSNIFTSMATNKNTSDINQKGLFSAGSVNSVPRRPGDVGDAEASVLATFGFLYDHEGSKDSSHLDEDEEEVSEDVVDAADRAMSTLETSYFDKGCSESTAMIRQKLDLFNNGNASNQTSVATGNATSVENRRDRRDNRITTSDLGQSNVSNENENWCPSQQKNEVVDIGELATLTTLASDSSDDYRRKQWTAKFRLQSHYDSVRALKFSEIDSTLVTVSDDETIKLWHLSRPSSASGKSRQPNLPPSMNAISSLESSTLDIEPVYTYRGHTASILSVTLCKNHMFSGAQNGELIMWKLIQDPGQADPFARFDSSLLVCRYVGHDDAVWSVEVIERPGTDPILLSVGADCTLKLWSTAGDKKEPLSVIKLDSSPTCIAKTPQFNVCHAGDFAISSCDGKIRLYDLQSCLDSTKSNTQLTATYECDEPKRINCIVIHPTLPYMASAGSNHDIKFWDMKSGECKSSMMAHSEEVTSLACDPSGKYLLSASHDCSVRIWLFEERACIQEITSHRKKFEEGIFAVAFHPNLSHFATAGADGLAKVFM